MVLHLKGAARAVALAAVLAAMGSRSVASMFLKVDVPTLRSMSDSVVQARVVDVVSRWSDDGAIVFTYVTLDVTGRLYGSSAPQIVVRVPGGTVGDFTSVMEGAPVFHEGDEIVAFLARWDDGAPMVAGYAEGLSTVVRDPAGNAILRGGLADGMPVSELAKTLARVGR